MTSDLLTTPEACEYLRTSRASLYRMHRDGLVKMQKVRGSTRWRRAELDRYLKAGERVA